MESTERVKMALGENKKFQKLTKYILRSYLGLHFHLIISNSQQKLKKFSLLFDTLLKTDSDELDESVIILPVDSRRKKTAKNVDFTYFLVLCTI